MLCRSSEPNCAYRRPWLLNFQVCRLQALGVQTIYFMKLNNKLNDTRVIW
jgi:hypothetical protein